MLPNKENINPHYAGSNLTYALEYLVKRLRINSIIQTLLHFINKFIDYGEITFLFAYS